jgi:hypothetical protein
MIETLHRIPRSFDPLIAEAKQRMRRRRLLAAALLVALIGGAAGATLILRGSGPGSSSSHGFAIGALKLTAPSRFYVHTIPSDGRHVIGAVVSDYRVQAHSPTIFTGVFPGNRVALVFGGALGTAASGAPALRLPLSVEELHGPQHHADGTAWNGLFRFRGRLYTVTLWAGEAAPPRDRASLLRVLASVQPAQ